MKPHRQKRLAIVLFIAVGISVGIGLTVYALRQNLNMFYTPTQVAAGEVPPGREIRVGGMVKEGSEWYAANSTEMGFVVTDYARDVPITYDGRLPDLFREGQGIVVEGLIDQSGAFQASRVIAKHDENYMSPEVKAALDAAHVDKPGYEQSARGLPDDT